MLMRRLIAGVVSIAVLSCSPAATPIARQPADPAPSPASTKPTPPPQPPPTFVASATLRDLAGARVGSVTLTETYAGVLIMGNINGLGLGPHAIHIHETGKCQVPFATAGAHFNPGNKHHGFFNPEGPHLG